MVSQGAGKMPCESCGVQFSVFRRKRACSECERLYCAGCLRRGGGMCVPCRALSTRPLGRNAIAHLKVRDLQCFLQRQNVSTRGCVEKEELVSLCITHVNSAAYRRRGPRTPSSNGPFTTLKGFTNNINEFINSAFDIRTATPAPAPQANSQHQTQYHSNCYNSSHAHSPVRDNTTGYPSAPPRRERFTTRPGGEPDIEVPPPPPVDDETPRSDSTENPPMETADCFEIEDLDDSGWEFVNRPAEPLPNDSEVLMTESPDDLTNTNTNTASSTPPQPQVRPPAPDRLEINSGSRLTTEAETTPRRSASVLDLRREPQPSEDHGDRVSLQDEPYIDRPSPETPKQVTLESMKEESELDALNVKQLKELLVRNRVEFRGCVERGDLLERARTLYRDHAKYRGDVDNLPLEECCKICMAAPLECVLLECGHIAACTACSKQLSECPFCRQYVVRAVRFFRT